MQRCNAARWAFVVTDIEDPLRVLITADWLWRRKGRLALELLLTTILDELTNIDGLIAAENDIVSARAQGVTGFDRNKPLALVARDLQAAHHPGAMQVTVVEFVLPDYVMLETVKIVFGK